jgi:hypothetical protein
MAVHTFEDFIVDTDGLAATDVASAILEPGS